MRKTLFIVALLAVSLLGAAQPARAALFTISGGKEYTTPKDDSGSGFPWWGNQVIPLTPGFLGAQLAFQGTPGWLYDITFEFVGFEAEWIDVLQTSGGNIDNRQQPGTLVAVRWRATGGLDIVPFSFVNGEDSPRAVANGTNGFPSLDPALAWPNFFLGIAEPSGSGATAWKGDVVWLALDDNGAGPDVDHDDWVGLVRAEPAPEPAALLLLASGLLSLSRRLRR